MQPSPKDALVTKEKALSGISTYSGNRFFDNSTLDSMRVCPRRFYYSKIRKWKQDRESVHLVFGSAWHASMDYLWQHPSASLEKVFEEFTKIWDASDFAETDLFDTFPKTPARAKDMLKAYIDRYRSWLENNIEVVAIEKSFIVPLSESHQNLFYIGKWDKLYKEGRFYHISDHKTTSSFSTSWLNSWSPNGQVDGYLYAGHMEYGDLFKSVMIDGALVQKTSIDFRRVPVERQIDMLDQWKWEVLDLIEQIQYYEDMLRAIRADNKDGAFLQAFPKCTTSCTSYYGSCPYLDLCKYVPNPETYKGDDLPNGFIKDTWQAFHIDETPSGEFVVKPLEHGE
jgi:hypothetical protein